MSDGYEIRVECSVCGALFDVPAIAVGSSESCPVCGTDVPVGRQSAGALDADEEELVELVAEPDSPADAAGPVSILPETAETLCFVCLAGEEGKLQARDVGPVIQSITGGNRYDVLAQINRGMGVVAQADAARAQKISEALSGRGFKSFVINAMAVPDLRPTAPVHQLAITGEGLRRELETLRTAELIRWSDMLALAMAVREGHVEKKVPGKERRHYGTGFAVAGIYGAMARPSYAPGRTKKELTHTLELYLLAREEGGRGVRRFCFGVNKVDMSCLGKAMTASATENFRRFCRGLVRRVPEVFVPESTQRFVEEGGDVLPEYSHDRQVDWHHRWLVCCALACRAGG